MPKEKKFHFGSVGAATENSIAIQKVLGITFNPTSINKKIRALQCLLYYSSGQTEAKLMMGRKISRSNSG